ncbi:MAG: hypothetical protein ACREJU_17425 [Nitrospiraceae bacterium]
MSHRHFYLGLVGIVLAFLLFDFVHHPTAFEGTAVILTIAYSTGVVVILLGLAFAGWLLRRLFLGDQDLSARRRFLFTGIIALAVFLLLMRMVG